MLENLIHNKFVFFFKYLKGKITLKNSEVMPFYHYKTSYIYIYNQFLIEKMNQIFIEQKILLNEIFQGN